MEPWFNSPFIVPIAGCIMIVCIVVARVYGEVAGRRVRSQERLTLIERGVPVPEIERMLADPKSPEVGNFREPLRGLATARRAATVLVSSGTGIVVFGLLLWLILQVRPVLVVAAVGAINILIGAGFAVDYRMQRRELEKFYPDVASNLELQRTA